MSDVPTIMDLCLKRQANKEKRGMPPWSKVALEMTFEQHLRDLLTELADAYEACLQCSIKIIHLGGKRFFVTRMIEIQDSFDKIAKNFPDVVRRVMEEEP